MPHLDVAGPPWPEIPAVREGFDVTFQQDDNGGHGPILYWKVCYDTDLYHTVENCVPLSTPDDGETFGLITGRVYLLRYGGEMSSIRVSAVALESKDPRCLELSAARLLTDEELEACSNTFTSQPSGSFPLPQAKAYVVPEAGLLFMLAAGLIGLWVASKWRRKNQ